MPYIPVRTPTIEAREDYMPGCNCVNCRRYEASLVSCEHCNEHVDCCECSTATNCGHTVAYNTICTTCSSCEQCCDCLECSNCRNFCIANDFCSRCDVCINCCRCVTCNSCSERFSPCELSDSVAIYCRECHNCNECCICEPQIIHSYSVNPLYHLKFLGHPKDGLYLGAEVEVELNRRGNKNEVAAQWSNTANGFYILKEDGSLSNGFEIVTAPAALRYHRKEWHRLLVEERNTLVDSLRCDEARSCGLHVHVTTKAIGTLAVGKIVRFMNDYVNRDKCLAIAGRETHYAEFNSAASKKAMRIAIKHKENPFRSLLPRYSVVNLTNKGTIEFRLFKGTLNYEKLMGRLEFTDAVCRWAVDSSLRDSTWEHFEKWVHKHEKSYRYFLGLDLTGPIITE